MADREPLYFVIAYFNYTDTDFSKGSDLFLSNFNIANDGIHKVNFFKTNSDRFQDMAIKFITATRQIPVRNVEKIIQSIKEKHIYTDFCITGTFRGVCTTELSMVDPGDGLEKGVYAFGVHYKICMNTKWHALDVDARRTVLEACVAEASNHGVALQIFNAKGLDNCDYHLWVECENPVDTQSFVYSVNSHLAPYSEQGIELQAFLTPTTPQRINHVQRYP